MADLFGKDIRPGGQLRAGNVSHSQPARGSHRANVHLRIKSNRGGINRAVAQWRHRDQTKPGSLATNERKRYWLTITAEHINEPYVWRMSRKFDLSFNLRGASVTSSFGLLAIELEGARPSIDKAVRWLERRGVQVDPLELSVIEG